MIAGRWSINVVIALMIIHIALTLSYAPVPHSRAQTLNTMTLGISAIIALLLIPGAVRWWQGHRRRRAEHRGFDVIPRDDDARN